MAHTRAERPSLKELLNEMGLEQTSVYFTSRVLNHSVTQVPTAAPYQRHKALSIIYQYITCLILLGDPGKPDQYVVLVDRQHTTTIQPDQYVVSVDRNPHDYSARPICTVSVDRRHPQLAHE